MVKKLLFFWVFLLLGLMILLIVFNDKKNKYLLSQVTQYNSLISQKQNLKYKIEVCDWVLNPSDEEIIECIKTKKNLHTIEQSLENEFNILIFVIEIQKLFKFYEERNLG